MACQQLIHPVQASGTGRRCLCLVSTLQPAAMTQSVCPRQTRASDLLWSGHFTAGRQLLVLQEGRVVLVGLGGARTGPGSAELSWCSG